MKKVDFCTLVIYVNKKPCAWLIDGTRVKARHARLASRRAQRKGGMTVQNIKRFVEHVKMDHEERLQDIRIQMKSLPPGDLIFARKNQKYYCVQKLNDQRFGITRDQQLVQGLALKRYLQEERDALQDNLKILDKVLKDCQNTSFDDIMQSLPPGFRQLPREYYRLKKKKKTYCKKPYSPEHLIYKTNGGELVRSKSEQSIGNALEDYGIEYTYDEGIIVGTRCYYADFVITCRDGHPDHLGAFRTHRFRQRLSGACSPADERLPGARLLSVEKPDLYIRRGRSQSGNHSPDHRRIRAAAILVRGGERRL